MLSLLNTTFTNAVGRGAGRVRTILNSLFNRATFVESPECVETTLEHPLAKKTSFSFTPSAYSRFILHAEVPKDGSGDMDFERSGVGSRVNEAGIIEEVQNGGTPRIDHSDGCPYLSLEPQSTNLVEQSETFSNWSTELGRQVVTPNTIISPDGNQTGSKLEVSSEASPTLRKLWVQKLVTVGDPYTFSVYIKKVDGQSGTGFLRITTGINDTFDVSQAYTATDQWQRISITTDSAVSSQIRFLITGDADSQIYIWGGQIEELPYATSYIPTSGAAATRSAEVAGANNVSHLINSAEGAIYYEGSALGATHTSNATISISDGTVNNRIYMYYTSAENQIRFRAVANGLNACEKNIDLTDITEVHKVLFLWTGTTFSIYINGAFMASHDKGRSIGAGVMDKISFNSGSGFKRWLGKVKGLRVLNIAPTAQESLSSTTL